MYQLPLYINQPSLILLNQLIKNMNLPHTSKNLQKKHQHINMNLQNMCQSAHTKIMNQFLIRLKSLKYIPRHINLLQNQYLNINLLQNLYQSTNLNTNLKHLQNSYLSNKKHLYKSLKHLNLHLLGQITQILSLLCLGKIMIIYMIQLIQIKKE